MAKAGDYTIENIYQGGYSSLEPDKRYGIKAGDLGLATDPRTANILKEVSSKVSTGVKQIELALVSPEVFDSIPKDQLKEVNRQAKLIGVDVSVHGPVIDTAGITQQGFSELNRESSERRIIEVVKRSHEINSEGNVPVTFHSSESIPGSEWKTLGEEGKPRQAKQIIAINQETGQMIPLREEIKYYPGKILKPGIEEKYEKGEIKEIKEEHYEQGVGIKERPHSPEENLTIANESEWDNKISQLFFNKERADEILRNNQVQIQHLMQDIQEKERKGIDPYSGLTDIQKQTLMKVQDTRNYLKEVNKTASNLFSKAYEFGDEAQRKKLIELNERYKKNLEKNTKDILGQSQAMHELLNSLQNPALAPRMFVPIEEFAVNQSSKTFGNAAFESFKKFKDKSPVICVENPPIGHALSTGEDLKNLIEASRKQFVERAKQEGISESEARRQAEKIIGATWDVGHINMLRKQGFGEEEVIKETEKIKPLLKHVHLSDNFGMEHTELPMGMGNVPIQEIMAKLGKKGFEAKKIIEAGQWWQHMQTPPVKETLQGIGAPIYSMGGMPYWDQSLGFYQGYSGGLEGAWLPQKNYETFGTGFSRLPAELGGQNQGGQGSRMSGRPME